MSRARLSDVLIARGADPGRIEEARAASVKANLSLVEAIQRTDAVPPKILAQALAELSGLPLVESVDAERVEVDLIQNISMILAREQGFMPLWRENGHVLAAIADLSTLAMLDDLRVLYHQPVRAVLMPSDLLRDTINKAFEKAAKSASDVLDNMEDEDDDLDKGLDLDGEVITGDPNQAPIIRFVNTLLTQAIKDRASDIHIEPFEKELSVRFRIDGVLAEVVKPPPRLQASIVSRVKIMAGLNIAEKRIPQDGRIRIRMAGREVDLRVSTLPVRHGERVVMRILEKGQVFNLDTIGMEEKTLRLYREFITRPYGIVLVTGPTGSGKTTTLYSGLSEINQPDLNILTIEDPIEYELSGIGQTQVNTKIDLTFASALRAHLRQDPDVIMVGEIRDKETADNAVQASLTGHLVFSTLHTNDSAGAFNRLTDMGVEPFLVSSSLLMVLAQRLVRRLCPDCKAPYTPTDVELKDVGLSREDVVGASFHKAVGCPACLSKGYRGRSGIYELLPVTDGIKSLVMQNKDSGTIKRQAVAEGMRTLRDDGIAKVMAGFTTFDEVLRVTQEDVVELD